MVGNIIPMNNPYLTYQTAANGGAQMPPGATQIPPPVTGAPNAATGGQNNDKGFRKDERDFVSQLMQMLGQGYQNPSQFNFGGMPTATAAQSNFTPNLQAPNIQAAQMNFDPRAAMGAQQMANPASVNFDISKYWNAQNQPGTVTPGQVNFSGPQMNNQYMDALTALIAKLGAAGSAPLQGLDPETQAALKAKEDAAIGGINQQYGLDKEALINSLFGRGANRSTIALDQSGKLLYGRDQLALQAHSDEAQRELALRQYLRDSGLQAMGVQGGFLGQQAGLQQNTDLQSSAQKLQALLANASNSQNASLANAQLGMQNQQLGLQAGGLDLQALLANAQNQQQASIFNAGQGNQMNQLIAQLGQQGALANAGFQQEAGIQNAQIGNQQQLATMQAGLTQALQNAGFSQQAAQSAADRLMQGLLANYSGGIQQQGQQSQTMAQMIDDLRQRSLGNKQINLGQGQLEEEKRKNLANEELQRRQLEAQLKAAHGSLFSKILGGIGLGGSLIPGIGPLIGLGAGIASHAAGGSDTTHN